MTCWVREGGLNDLTIHRVDFLISTTQIRRRLSERLWNHFVPLLFSVAVRPLSAMNEWARLWFLLFLCFIFIFFTCDEMMRRVLQPVSSLILSRSTESHSTFFHSSFDSSIPFLRDMARWAGWLCAFERAFDTVRYGTVRYGMMSMIRFMLAMTMMTSMIAKVSFRWENGHFAYERASLSGKSAQSREGRVDCVPFCLSEGLSCLYMCTPIYLALYRTMEEWQE